MPKISLKIHFPNSHEGYKMMQFEDTTLVKKAIEEINSKRNERKANLDTIKGKRTPPPGHVSRLFILNVFSSPVSDYGLFSFKDEKGAKVGQWLDPDRELQYYLLREGV